MHLELNEGPSDSISRHNFVVSGTALVPYTARHELQLGGARASGLPVHA